MFTIGESQAISHANGQNKRKFYEEKVRNTRKDDVRQWWRTVSVMSERTYSQSCFTLERDGVELSEGELAESLNQYFATVAADIPPLDTSCLHLLRKCLLYIPTWFAKSFCM